jgi:hypothetical protein
MSAVATCVGKAIGDLRLGEVIYAATAMPSARPIALRHFAVMVCPLANAQKLARFLLMVFSDNPSNFGGEDRGPNKQRDKRQHGTPRGLGRPFLREISKDANINNVEVCLTCRQKLVIASLQAPEPLRHAPRGRTIALGTLAPGARHWPKEARRAAVARPRDKPLNLVSAAQASPRAGSPGGGDGGAGSARCALDRPYTYATLDDLPHGYKQFR